MEKEYARMMAEGGEPTHMKYGPGGLGDVEEEDVRLKSIGDVKDGIVA